VTFIENESPGKAYLAAMYKRASDKLQQDECREGKIVLGRAAAMTEEEILSAARASRVRAFAVENPPTSPRYLTPY
jgi:hypothetical protein